MPASESERAPGLPDSWKSAQLSALSDEAQRGRRTPDGSDPEDCHAGDSRRVSRRKTPPGARRLGCESEADPPDLEIGRTPSAAEGPQETAAGQFENGTQRLQAERINQVWSYDFVFDQTESGGRLKWLPVLDEFSRECLSLEVERSMTSGGVIGILDELVAQRGAPEFIRSDNGPEFVANAVKDWIAEKGFKTLFIKPGSPWQNCYSESFNARFRDEFLNVEAFSSLLEAKVLGEEHRDKYNHRRPHSSLGDLTPVEFAAACLKPPSCSKAPSASDEFRSHSRLPEPVNNPRASALEKSLPISNRHSTKPPSLKANKPKNQPQLS